MYRVTSHDGAYYYYPTYMAAKEAAIAEAARTGHSTTLTRGDGPALAAEVRGRMSTLRVPDRTPVTVEPVREKVSEEGIYFDGEHYYKAVRSERSGHFYAKVWDDPDWDYAPGAIKDLFADQRVSAEQAARFGALYGHCVFCSRRLTDERSIAVGYGPVCAEREGLPWGEES